MNLIRTISIFACVFLVTLLPTTGNANPYISTIYAFGDSLSDTGNVYVGSQNMQPSAPYYNGQYSNGPTWVQGVSAGLGLAPLNPSLAGGNDYAFGGATTSYAPTVFADVPNLTQQITSFSTTLAGKSALPSGLYTVWIGANDIFNILGSTAGACVTDPSGCVLGAAQAEANDIGTLSSLGATNFLVPLVPNLGATPIIATADAFVGAGGTLQTFATFLSQSYNDALKADLASLATTPGIHLAFLDTFALLDNAIVNPSALGLTNVTDACYTGGETGGGPVCANPNQYLFWDAIHPTETGHTLIAQAALAEVPEPGTVMILALGLAIMWRLRRTTLTT